MVKTRAVKCAGSGVGKQTGSKCGAAKARGYKAAARSPKRISVSGHDSNDSVLIAGYLTEFSYDPGRRDAVLKKYEKLLR